MMSFNSMHYSGIEEPIYIREGRTLYSNNSSALLKYIKVNPEWVWGGLEYDSYFATMKRSKNLWREPNVQEIRK